MQSHSGTVAARDQDQFIWIGLEFKLKNKSGNVSEARRGVEARGLTTAAGETDAALPASSSSPVAATSFELRHWIFPHLGTATIHSFPVLSSSLSSQATILEFGTDS